MTRNDIHEITFPCAYWRPCCCKDNRDWHCWGCGCERSAHKDGDHEYFAEKFAKELGSAIEAGKIGRSE